MQKVIYLVVILVIVSGCQTNQPFGGELKDANLEKEKNNIIKSEEKDWIECTDKQCKEEINNKGKIIEYYYVSDEIDEQKTKKIGGKEKKELMDKRTSSISVWETDKKDENNNIVYLAKAEIGDVRFKRNGEWYKVKKATTTPELYEEIVLNEMPKYLSWLKPVLAQTSTSTYAESGAGNVYVDDGNFSTAHLQADGETVAAYYCRNKCKTSTAYRIERCFFPMKTHGLPDGATISSSSLEIYSVAAGFEDDHNEAESYTALVNSATMGDYTTLATGDYDTCGDAVTNPTKISADKDLGSWSNDAWNNIPLNAAGLASVEDDDYTKIGLRIGHDIENSACTQNSNGWSGIQYSTGATDPFLLIEYTEGGGGDSCTPDGGDHTFMASDNCNIYTDVYVDGSCNFYTDSAGGINIGAKLECEDGCYIDQDFSINIGSTGSFICQQ